MKKYLPVLIVFLSASLSAQNLRSGGKLKPEQAIMDIRHYTVALTVDPEKQTINGYTDITLVLSETSPILLFDLWHGLTVEQVLVNGKKETFNHAQNDLLTITGAKSICCGQTAHC
ncbi:MAG: hypothetical protein U5K54_21465 [Cytophagales bacterium]|nr:hypothetical protein [Cytophagales bacterium]